MRRFFPHILLIAMIAMGCTVGSGIYTDGPANPAGIESIVLSYDISETQRYWADEIAPRYPDALLVIAHGETDSISGEWYAYPTRGSPLPVRQLVENMRDYHPDRHIVLLICNPDGLLLFDVEHVSYALNNVWVITDDKVKYQWRDVVDPDGVGSFQEFVHVE